jgi:hypothetical protein
VQAKANVGHGQVSGKAEHNLLGLPQNSFHDIQHDLSWWFLGVGRLYQQAWVTTALMNGTKNIGGLYNREHLTGIQSLEQLVEAVEYPWSFPAPLDSRAKIPFDGLASASS